MKYFYIVLLLVFIIPLNAYAEELTSCNPQIDKNGDGYPDKIIPQVGVDWSYCNLIGIELIDKDLSNANLVGADLSSSSVANANLLLADLTNADLSDMVGWDDAFWLAATYNSHTVLPTGMDPDSFAMIEVPAPTTLFFFVVGFLGSCKRRLSTTR